MVARRADETQGVNAAEVDYSTMSAAEIADALANERSVNVAEQMEEIDERGFARVYKDSMCGKPFRILYWEDEMTEYGLMATVYAMLGKKFVKFTDGSTGVYKQLKTLREEKGVSKNILAPKGLTKSTYKNPHGEGDATTYYLDVRI